MGRKVTDRPIRNRERTMKLLEAVGEIIRTEGHAKLGVNHVARTAGVSKKLIYRHFGSLNDLIELYIRRKDFWVGERRAHSCGIGVGTGQGKQRITKVMDRIVDWSFEHTRKN